MNQAFSRVRGETQISGNLCFGTNLRFFTSNCSDETKQMVSVVPAVKQGEGGVTVTKLKAHLTSVSATIFHLVPT